MSRLRRLNPLDPLPHILSCGSFNLLAGASGVGKTGLVAAMAVAFRDGHPIFGHQPNPVSGIAYVVSDRPWDIDAQLWFEEVGFPEITHHALIEDEGFNLTRFRQKHTHAKILADILDGLSLPPGGLVFVDPMPLFLGGNIMDYIGVAVTSIELHRVIRARQLTVVGLMHASKQKSDSKERYARLQDRSAGTGALQGFSGTQMYLAGPEELAGESRDGRVGTHEFMWNPHHHRRQAFSLSQDAETGQFDLSRYTEVNPPPVVENPREVLTGLPDDLLSILIQFPPPPTTVSTSQLVMLYQDRDRATVFRQLGRLRSAGYLETASRGLWRRTGKIFDGERSAN